MNHNSRPDPVVPGVRLPVYPDWSEKGTDPLSLLFDGIILSGPPENIIPLLIFNIFLIPRFNFI